MILCKANAGRIICCDGEMNSSFIVQARAINLQFDNRFFQED